MPKAKPHREAPLVKPQDAAELVAWLDDITVNYQGDIGDLEAAVGMLMFGRIVGWRVIVLIHNKKTIRKYEQILGDINIREVLPETTEFSEKSVAYTLVKKLGNFWKAVNGEEKDEELRERRRELAL